MHESSPIHEIREFEKPLCGMNSDICNVWISYVARY